MGKYLELEDLGSYTASYEVANYVWNVVITWEYFSKQTIGIQFVRAVDSISANIAEGFGRYGKKDKIKFYYYSLGSLKESYDWLNKAKARKLLTDEQYLYISQHLQNLPKEIHQLIKFTNEKLRD